MVHEMPILVSAKAAEMPAIPPPTMRQVFDILGFLTGVHVKRIEVTKDRQPVLTSWVRCTHEESARMVVNSDCYTQCQA